MPNEYSNGAIGGALIGLAAVLLYWFNGRIMGISGITSRLLQKISADSLWRVAFISGLVSGGVLVPMITKVQVEVGASVPILIAAGLLVGYGTVLGNGCTSGHGICGIARASKRSIVATFIFISMGVLTVWVKHLLGV